MRDCTIDNVMDIENIINSTFVINLVFMTRAAVPCTRMTAAILCNENEILCIYFCSRYMVAHRIQERTTVGTLNLDTTTYPEQK